MSPSFAEGENVRLLPIGITGVLRLDLHLLGDLRR